MKFVFYLFSVMIILLFFSCSKPAETKEEFIQKGIIMSDTLLKSVDGQLKDAELAVDSAIKMGYFVPPPPVSNTSTSQGTVTTKQKK